MRYEEAFVGRPVRHQDRRDLRGHRRPRPRSTSGGRCATSRAWPSRCYLSPKRHPFDMKVKLGADADGRLTALGMDILVDNGAYISMGNVVMLRAVHMLSGSYDIPNVDALARLVYTNNPWGAAARGAGPPQTHYALESAHRHAGPQDGHRPARVPAAQLAAARADQGDRARSSTSGRSPSCATRSSPTTSAPCARRARRARPPSAAAWAWAPAPSASAGRATRAWSPSSSTPTTA